MSHKFFENKNCEYYPCHDLQKINCLFCFCPLYFTDCKGDYQMRKNIKDCSGCTMPHAENGYDFVIEKLKQHLSSLQN